MPPKLQMLIVKVDVVDGQNQRSGYSTVSCGRCHMGMEMQSDDNKISITIPMNIHVT